MVLIFGICGIFNQAYSEPFPRGCEARGFEYQDDYLMLNNTGKQAFYMIQNRNSQVIEMQRVEMRGMFISPPLTAKIDALGWSAFASNTPNFYFQCFIINEDTSLPIPCLDVLEVCEYPRVRFSLSNQGNYWVSINKSQQQIIQDAVDKGIYLKW